MASRDDFVAQLIAALQENEAMVSGTRRGVNAAGSASQEDASQFFSVPAPTPSNWTSTSVARSAYDCLQYDFPLVEDGDVAALAEAYQSIVDGRVEASAAREFAITRTLVDGIEYLNDTMNKRRGSEASALLAAAVLLLVPRYCIQNPESPLSAVLLSKLHVPNQGEAPAKTPANAYDPASSMNSDASHSLSEMMVEVYAAEEDPDDLSLVYEGDVPTPQTSTHSPDRQHEPTHDQIDTSPDAMRHSRLLFLAKKTFSTSFSLISGEKWLQWRVDQALCDLVRLLVDAKAQSSENEASALYGIEGEWQRYLFTLRDRMLRQAENSEVCSSGLKHLKALVDDWQQAPRSEGTLGDPFFSFTSASSAKNSSTKDSEQVRVVFRVFAELAVSKEFNAVAARHSQYALATAIQQLFPVILHEFQSMSSCVNQTDFDATSGDFVVVLLQLLHFVVDANGSSAASHQIVIDKLQDSGLLRACLSLIPTVTEHGAPLSWGSPLLRLLAESALWNAEFAAYVHRVPKVMKLLDARVSCESILMKIAAYQNGVPGRHDAPSVLWAEFSSDAVFPSACDSFIESMEKMSNALFLLDALSKSVASLRSQVVEELRSALQSLYGSRFSTAFQYPSFVIPSDDVVPSTLNKDEPEPPPVVDGPDERPDETEERGRAEALQFLALRNRLRQTAKSILLSKTTYSSSSKLD